NSVLICIHYIPHWQPTNNTHYYVATAVDDTGKATKCMTLDRICYFTEVSCGRFYTYNKLKVSWSISVPTENYTTIISRAMGPPLYCNSTDTQCTVGGLWCERSYTVTVFSITGTCLSLPSKEVVVKTCEDHINKDVKDVMEFCWVHPDTCVLLLFSFSAVSSNQRHSCAHVRFRSRSCIVDSQR
ncbi:hypothetical protein GOODEAATRI_005477, partial [Goodea atripinnis]